MKDKRRNMKWTGNNFLLAVLVFTFAGLTGCGGPVKQVDTGPVFFPPPPNDPRVQFLKGISDSMDVEDKKQSFSLIIVGQEERETVKKIAKPYGVATHNGKIYVADTAAANVIIMDLALKTFEYLKGNYSTGKLKKPINIDVDEEGRMYVTDTVRKEVLVYDAAGNYRHAYGRDLDWKPIDVDVIGGRIYVTDFKNYEIKVLDATTGELLTSFGSTGAEDKLDHLSMPMGLSVNERGYVRVVNMSGGRVVTLDLDGHVIDSFGKMGDGFGQFGRPKGVAVDDKDRIYVVDAAHQNVQVFRDDGRLLIFFGDPGLPRGSTNMPAAVAVTRDNLEYYQSLAEPGFILEEVVIVTSQFGDDKIQIYGLGEMK